MEKICLISAGSLPIPAVLGGAIETIITNVIDQNEIYKQLDITVVSIYNKEAWKLSKKYKYTKFIFINKKSLSYIMSFGFNKLKNICLSTTKSIYVNTVLRKIKHLKFDKLIVEGGHYDSYYSFLKYFDRSQMVLHLHHHYFSNVIINKTFGTILTVSDFVGKEWLKTSKNQNVVTIKNCIDISKFNKDLTVRTLKTLKKKYNIQEDDFVVAYCGRLVEIKGVLELIKSIKNINNEKLKLLLIGSSNFSDNSKTEYVRKIEEEIVPIKDRVIFTGYIDNKELYKYYKLSSMVVIPTIVEDAAPLTTIEALACGKPLLVTRSGGIPEYVNDKNSIIVEKDKNLIKSLTKNIELMMNDSKLLNTMSKEALKASKKMDLDSYYKNFYKTISKLK